jgi:hypothetical protein
MLPREMFPSELMAALRKQAQECEDSERWPKTGASMRPKETTLEWAAAEQIECLLQEIRMYEGLYHDIIVAMDNFEEPKKTFKVRVRKKNSK